MIAIANAPLVRQAPARRAWVEAGLVTAGLGAMVAARLAATRAGLDPLVVGAAFGLALLGLRSAGGARTSLGARLPGAALAGVGVGLGLVIVGLAGLSVAATAHVTGLGRQAPAFGPWALVTVTVAVAEEGVLRGLLFDLFRRAGGTLLALAATTVLFALMHVPLYGWHVVPLDLAVGLALGGLRIVSRGALAPAIAHAIADLATWWL